MHLSVVESRIRVLALTFFVVKQSAKGTYLETLCEFREELGIKIYGYCLMTNHVHLIVDPGDDASNLGLLMKRLAGRPTRRINRLERRTGTSWEGRHELKLIRAAVQRNQLTGGEAFILEIEQQIGERILFRSRDRPSSGS